MAEHRNNSRTPGFRRPVGRTWQVELGPWPDLPSAHIEKLPAPPSSVTLIRYAELYSAAGLIRRDETGRWDADAILAVLAERDEFLHTTFSLGYIDPDGALLAECSVGISDTTARLYVVHATEQPADLAHLLRGTLYRLHVYYPDVRTAEVTMDPRDEPFELALTATGFTVRNHTA
ncbi:hypothetical protein ACWEO2_10725 [Nocardia sp. NPDC004278]|uniref:hypothetical protein n=1 Tax=Nocardia sp. NPDC004604 TaxID=3157013 RepID=UPI0033B05947